MSGTHRIGILGLWHETNTYSARPAGRKEFADFELLAGADIVTRHRGTGSVIGGFIDGTDEQGSAVVPLFSAGAWPAGPVDGGTLDLLLGQARDALDRAGELDGLLLNLHGAMVAQGEPDVEARLLRLIRETRGTVPVAAVLDLHGNPSAELAATADIVIGYDTYPHVDMWERGVEAATLLHTVLAGTPLRTAIAKRPLLTCPLAQSTDGKPMRTLLADAQQRCLEVGGRRISLLAGFPYSDVDRAGFSVLVVDTADRLDAAANLATEVANRAEEAAARGEFAVSRHGPADAVRQAIRSTRPPVVLADVADNIGGGSAGDGTVLLTELLRQGAEGAVVVLSDADVARSAAAHGPGAELRADVGGKTDRLHGDPVPVEGRVVRVTDGSYTTAGTWATGRTFSMGTTAVLDLGGVTLVVTERATPPFHPEHLTSVGIQPADARILVAKGAVAWRAAYGDVAGEVIEVDGPGACPIDPWTLPRSAPPTGC